MTLIAVAAETPAFCRASQLGNTKHTEVASIKYTDRRIDATTRIELGDYTARLVTEYSIRPGVF